MEPLLALEASPVAAALRRSAVLYPLASAALILGSRVMGSQNNVGLLVGAIATLDLRLLGAFRRVPLGALGAPPARVAAAGLGLALATGVLLFSVRASEYAANPAFLVKLGLVAGGLLNVLALRRGGGWGRALAGGAVGWRLRCAAALSLGCWLGALLAGRWIAFLA